MKQLNTHFDPIGHMPINEQNLKFNEFTGYYIHVPKEDNTPIRFKWHFPRGTLSKHMSGYELGIFVLKHMQACLGQGLFDAHPKIKNEFEAMFFKLATSPKEVLDQLLGWIKVKLREDENDIIYMSLYDNNPEYNTRKYFI